MSHHQPKMHSSRQRNLEHLIQKGPFNEDLDASLRDLRYFIIMEGIPCNSDGMSELRIYVWLILLNAPAIRTDVYLDLVRQGPSPAYSKIRNDTFRTMATDPLFRRRVTENSLTRVLNAVSWKLTDAYEARINGWMSPPTLSQAGSQIGDMSPPSSNSQLHQAQPQQQHSHQQHLTVSHGRTGITESPVSRTAAAASAAAGAAGSPSLGGTTAADVTSEADFNHSTITTNNPQETSLGPGQGPPAEQVGYVQGMNVLAAPFLYAARSESEAFVAFDRFIARECPAYVRGSMEGVHRGLALVNQILDIVDPKLSSHLLSKGLKAEIYAFPSVLTMCACTPPLPELLALWDFLLAWGPHLNLVCIVAQLSIMRDRLLASSSPNQLLRSFPPLNADKIKQLTLSFASKLPEPLYVKILNHAK